MPELGEHFYAEAISIERWLLNGEARRVESITGVGWSEASKRRSQLTYVAGDKFDGDRKTVEEKIRAALAGDESTWASNLWREPLQQRADVRIFRKARSVESEHGANLDAHTTITIVTGVAAIVARPESVASDLEVLRVATQARSTDQKIDVREYPLVWRRGSGAVLLHEAIGHPAERSTPPIEWPAWLDVVDDPLADGLGTMSFDDTGRTTRSARLKSESPDAFRRESFRDIPRRRMTNLIVTASASAPLPDPRVEIFLIDEGGYDPLTEIASLSVAAATFVDGNQTRALPKFRLQIDRTTLASRLLGSVGPTTSYPGVICFDEGQRVPVGSNAPDLVTAPFGLR